jgi:hypothetical protein
VAKLPYALCAASEFGIRTVAIYEDRYSLHRYKADKSYQICEDTYPLKPYLDIDQIIGIAKIRTLIFFSYHCIKVKGVLKFFWAEMIPDYLIRIMPA